MWWFGRALGASIGIISSSCARAPLAVPVETVPAAPSAHVAVPTAPQASATPVETPPIAADRLRPLRGSALLPTLEKVGLTGTRLPRLEELSARQRLPVMEAFSEALGVKCSGCHVNEQDFGAETRNKQIARHMWNDFVVPLRLEGKAVFCDSCHQGSASILPRGDRAAVSAYMKHEFAGKLQAATGAAVSCETCHGAPFEPHIFEQRWGAKG